MILAAIVGLLVGLAAGFAIATAVGTGTVTAAVVTKEVAGQRVVDWLSANDVPATLLVVSEEHGLYKVTVKANATSVAGDFYVTNDGGMLSQSGIIDLNQTTSQLIGKRAFFDCLAIRGMMFFGSTATNSTLMQLQVFGGTQFVDRIYVSCDGNQTQSCVDAGITEVPLFVYENRTYTGVKTLDWFANLTGC